MNQPENWMFDPWNLGRDVSYNGLRLLLIGESHYDDGDELTTDPVAVRRFTTDVVNYWAKNGDGGRHRFFPYIFETVSGETWSADSQEADRFWNSVYFYNYVQSLALTGARQRPTAEMFRDSEDAFYAVLKALRPDVILVLGKALWDALPDGLGEGPSFPSQGKTWRYDCGDGRPEALATYINHPSSTGFTPALWHLKVTELLAMGLERQGR
jgi:hypothetical protein